MEMLPDKIDSLIHIMSNNSQKSMTQSLCPKYRKFTNFPSKHNNNNNNQQKQLQTITNTNTHNNNPSPSISISPILINHHSQSITNQPQSPLPKKLYSKQSHSQQQQQQITSTFTQLNQMIINVSQLFQKRMKTHQDQLIKVMMIEIRRLNKQCSKTIQKYNQLIRIKSYDTGNHQIMLQLGLYKTHATNMQTQNQTLKKQIQYLKRLNNQYQIKIKTDQQTLIKVTKKYLHYKQKINNINNHNNTITQSAQYIKQLPSHIAPITDFHSMIKSNAILPDTKLSSQSHSLLQQQHKNQQKHQQSLFTKPNSKSLAYSRRSHPFSIQKSSLKMNSQQQVMDIEQQVNSSNMQNSLLVKLNQKYNTSNDKVNYLKNSQLININRQTPHHNYSVQQSNQQLHNNHNQSQLYQNNHNKSPQIINRQNVVRFLKQTRPSIKQIVNKKKSQQQRNKNNNYNNNKNYNNKKKKQLQINQQHQYSSQNKIKMIKNRVRLSSFDQKQFINLKKSLQLSLQQKYRAQQQQFVNNYNQEQQQQQQLLNH